MKILVNEQTVEVEPNTTLFGARDAHSPGADVLIYNGFIVAGDVGLAEGDTLVFIKKGELPGPAEMEALMMARHTPGTHELVKKAVVGIAGLGGLGSSCAIALCRMGVGKLVLADFDVVEPSNLNRQQYFIDQIGMLKTDAMKENLARTNPYVKVDAHSVKLDETNIPSIFGEASVVVEAFDRPDMKVMIIRTVLDSMPDTQIICASGVAGFGDGNEIKAVRFSPRLVIVGDFKSEAKPGMGLMAPRVGIAAHQQANTVIRIILGEEV